MMYIAHRGNLEGPIPESENNPEYIDYALYYGFEAEIDLRVVNGLFYLGHDEPQYRIDLGWLEERKHKLWIHCKNAEALEKCIDNDLHCFFHNTDDYTITSGGFVWAYPGKPRASERCILVMPELNHGTKFLKGYGYSGICSDYIENIRKRADAKKYRL
jgi:hypothetical protein